MFKKILVVLMLVLFTSPIYASEIDTDEKPTVSSVVYSPEKGSVNFSDGTSKNLNPQEMGHKEYEWYFSRLKVGQVEPAMPTKKIRYILLTTIVQDADPEIPPTIVNTKINGVTMEGEIESVTSETE